MWRLQCSTLVIIVCISLITSCVFADDFTSKKSEADKIYNQMTLDQRIGQLLLPSYPFLVKGQNGQPLCQPGNISITNCGFDKSFSKLFIGSVLEDGGPFYGGAELITWQTLNKAAQNAHHQFVSYDPLLLTGNDALHGNSHVAGSVIFPHNINIGVTHDPKLLEKMGELVAKDSLYSGFNWVYIPTVANSQDIRWGRTYESFGQDPKLIHDLAYAYITGLQKSGVIATVKHFVGDGSTDYGHEEGNATFLGSKEDFWKIHGQGYDGALNAGVLSLMASFNGINKQRMHFGGPWNLLQDFKKNRFTNGFVTSDYNGAERAEFFTKNPDYTNINLPPKHPVDPLDVVLAKSFNAGVDIFMVGLNDKKNPFDSSDAHMYANFISDVHDAIKKAYLAKQISGKRLHDAVIRILTAKLIAVDKINKTLPTINYKNLQQHERNLALTLAEESLVLLKNNKNLLPLKSKKIKHIIIVGPANDIGLQNGGWTINWQGQKGPDYFEDTPEHKKSSGATTLLEGLKLMGVKDILDIKNISQLGADISKHKNDTVIITVVSEVPYAEYMGDIGNVQDVHDPWYDNGTKGHENKYMPLIQSKDLSLHWSSETAKRIKFLHDKGIPVITIVYSGRPVVLGDPQNNSDITAPLPNSDAVIAAFLPGTRGGEALANAIFGKYLLGKNGFSNKLTFPWPKNNNEIQNKHMTLFPMGYGLTTR